MKNKSRDMQKKYKKRKERQFKRSQNDHVRWTPFEFSHMHDPTGIVQNPQTAEIWINSRYQVSKYPPESGSAGRIQLLSIKRLDKQPLHDWRDLQRIKNELVGSEIEAVEIYPAESRLVDTANQYHLWCFLDMRLPFGFHVRMVSDTNNIGAVNRKFEDPPPDNFHIETIEQFQRVEDSRKQIPEAHSSIPAD